MPKLELSIAQHYHERTKYDPETLASKNYQLDWDKQPIPFKEYKIGTSIDLKPYLKANVLSTPDGEWWQRLSRLLFCSYGLTGKVPTIDKPLYLRSAPSAGGLYPAEIYLISRGTGFLGAGLYNYQPQSHTLLRFWDDSIWPVLQQACFQHPALDKTHIAIATTAVFYRSAWRYLDRAYRRIFLDTGHLLANIELAGSLTRFRPYLTGGFLDEQVNNLLFLDSQQEGTLSVIALADLDDAAQILMPVKTAFASGTQTEYPHIPDGSLLAYLHKATEIKIDPNVIKNWEDDSKEISDQDKYNFPFCTKISSVTPSITWGKDLEGLENTLLRRRSTRSYSGGDITIEELKALLDFTYQPHHYIDQGLDGKPDFFDLSLIETFIAVSGVRGLEEGCYYYAPKAQEFRQIRFKNFRKELHYLCLGQELGRDAGALVFQTADLKNAVAKYGDRVYRYLHLDAGHLGQRLNLAAIHLGLGVSGIGGFFDDQVNDVLGIPADEAVIYITTLGRPR
jgi:SagB-type dehydrogenase family enzyme